jgi:hypothetical protein
VLGRRVVCVLPAVRSRLTQLDGSTRDPPSEQLLAGVGRVLCCPLWLGGAAAVLRRRVALGRTRPVLGEFGVSV